MAEKKTTDFFKRKMIILSDPLVNRDFLINHPKVKKGFGSNQKEFIGVDILLINWRSLNNQDGIQFVVSDIDTSPRFESTRRFMLHHAHSCILIYDFTCSDFLINLEKWITEVVVNCGNIPIVLVGKNLIDCKIESKKAEIEALVENKKTSWELTIENFNVSGKGSEIEEVINAIGNMSIEHLKNPKLGELRTGTLKNFESLITSESDIVYINKILFGLSKLKKKSIIELLYNLTSFLEQLLKTQEQLTSIPALITTLRLIDLQFARTLIDLSFDNLIEKVKQEKNLREINLLLKELSKGETDLLVKFLAKLPTNLLAKKIAQAWIASTIIASYTHSSTMEIIQAANSGDSQLIDIIRYVSEMENERKKKETLFEISCLFATIFSIKKAMTLEILEESKNQIRDLAEKELDKVDDTTSDKDSPLKSSLEIGAYSKKEAARIELFSGLSELDLVNISMQELSFDDRVALINELTIDRIYSKIEVEKKLLTIYEFLNTISETDSKLLRKTLNRNEKIIGEKIALESSVIVIIKLLELIKNEMPKKLPKMLKSLTIENWLNKMVLYYADLDLEHIDIPLMLSISLHFGKENKVSIIQFLMHRYPEIAAHDLLTLIRLINELVLIVKDEFIHDQEDISNQALEIFDFFINEKLTEILKLLKLISKELEISKDNIKEIFLPLLLTEDKNDFSYEKERLFDFISNLPL